MSKLDAILPDTLDTPEAALSRRSLVQTLGGAALAMTVLAGCGGSDDSNNSNNGGNNGGGNNSTANDQAVLQFALHLEYLEAEFYSYATTGQGLEGKVELTGVGTLGQTVGKFQTNFSSPRGAAVAQEIARDELEHVRLVRTALGGAAIARPALDYTTVPGALGLDLTTEAGFLALARAFEDVGVTAYIGGAPYLSTGVLRTASKILAVEALHTGNIRLQLVQQGAPAGQPLDSKDFPPDQPDSLTGGANNFFATDASALAFGRTPTEVLRIVLNKPTAQAADIAANPRGGFFPAGLNLSQGNAARLLAITN